MALDPNISLGVKNFAPDPQVFQNYALNGMKMALMGQQIAQSQQEVEASKSQQANTEAQNPGIIAQSTSAQIKADQDAGRVKAAQGAVETDPTTGQPLIDPNTGTAKINFAKYQKGLFDAGLGNEAIEQAGKQYDNVKKSQGNAAAEIELVNGIRNTAAVAAKAAADQTAGSQAQKNIAAKTVWDRLTTQATAGAEKAGHDLSGQDFSYVPGSQDYLYKAQISPGAQEQLKISQGQLGLGWANNNLATKQFENSKITTFTDPESQDAGSPASQRARDIVKNTTGEDLPANMSATAIYNNPKYQQTLTSTGANAGAALVLANKDLNTWQSFDKSLDAAKGQLSTLGLTPAQFVSNYANGKLTSTPELSALYGQMSLLPSSVVNASQSFDSMKQVNAAMIDQASRNVKSAAGNRPQTVVAGSGSSPSVSPGAPQPAANNPSPALSGHTQTMTKDGKSYAIPVEKVNDAKKLEYQ